MLGRKECLLVGPEDVIGIMNEAVVGPVGYNFAESGVTAYFYSFNNSFPRIGDEIIFDQLGLPFDFGLTAVYDTGNVYFGGHS